MQPKTAYRGFKQLTGQLPLLKVVDVGANPLVGQPPYAASLKDGAEVLGFEPQPEALNRLLAQKTDRETYLPHAIGDGQVHTLNICVAYGMSSLLIPDPAMLARFHGFAEWGRILDQGLQRGESLAA